jgi:tetratricopeptide (TPR) repeat protein
LALSDYKRLIQKHTDRSEVYARVGDILCSEPYADPQHIKQANSFYTIAISIDSTQGSYFASRGMTSFSMGNFDASLDDFLKAITLNYTNPELYAQTGYSYQQLHDFKRALYYYNKAIDGDPTNVEYFANRGEALLAMHQLDGAIDDFNKYISKVPDNYQVYYSLARAQYGLQQYDSSISSLKKSLALWNNEVTAGNADNRMGAEIWFRIGLAAADKGDYKLAVDAFNNSLKLSPTGGDASLYYNLGLAKAKADPKSDYCSDLKKAADKGFPDAVKMYVKLCGK